MHWVYAGVATAVAFVIVLPTASAVIFAGSEESPEIVDPEGDVEYDEMYLGPKDRDLIDVLSGWYSYDNSTDAVSVTVKLADSTEWESPNADWASECRFSGNTIVEGERTGSLGFRVRVTADGTLESLVDWSDAASGGKVTRISHEFDTSFAAPGYFTFRLPREALFTYADEVSGIGLRCDELYRPGRQVSPVSASVYFNQDQTAGGIDIPVQSLQPVSTSNGDGDLPGRSAAPTTDAPAESFGVSFLGVISTVLLASLAYRLRRIQ